MVRWCMVKRKHATFDPHHVRRGHFHFSLCSRCCQRSRLRITCVLSRRVDDDDLSIGSSRAPAGLVWPLVEEGLTRARSSAVKTRSAPPRIRHHHPKLPISVTIMLLLMQSSKLYLRGVVSVGIHGKIVRKQLVWTSSVCENRLVQRTSSV